MRWNSKFASIKLGSSIRFALSIVFVSLTALSCMSDRVMAQVGTAPDNLGWVVQNQFLSLYVGSGKNVGGTIEIDTSANNATDPSGILMYGGFFLTGVGIEAQNAPLIITGSRLFVRVDGGKNGGGGGYDYVFGRNNATLVGSDGFWIAPPHTVGQRIEARWQTLPITVNAKVIDPRIEIDLVASIIHDQVRFQFTIKNNSPGQAHTVGLAFTEDVDTTFFDLTTFKPDFTFGGPLRLPNGPYLHKETLLVGGQVPNLWDVFVLGPAPPSKTSPRIRSIRGILGPQNSGQTEPTRPSRFAFGRQVTLNGFNPNPTVGVVGRDYDVIWNFLPDPTVPLEGANGVDAAVTLFWDEQVVSPGQSIPITTFLGQSTSDTDFSPPVSLSVSSPGSLGYQATKDVNGVVIGCASNPTDFVVSAFVQNLTDLVSSVGITVSPVTLFLDLPPGLVLAPGETNPKTVLNLAPGSEGGVTWKVIPDGTVTGTLRFTVTASPNIGNGKSVQRTIDVPNPPSVNLKSNTTTQGLFSMVSFPLIFGNTPPSTVLGLNANLPQPDFDLVRYNPVTGHYEPVNTFVPGLAYWLRSRLSFDKHITIDCTKYPPLDNQVQPNNTTFKVNYPRGWNQIGNPYLYNIRFSEIQVFDTATLQIVDVNTASDSLHQWILPALYFYDTSDSNPQNWAYKLEDGLGFDMQPYQGYWMLVKRDGLQFIFPGVDKPNASVTRKAPVSSGASRFAGANTSDNWRLQLVAQGTVSRDSATYIGVSPKATDSFDYYKLSKPPIVDNQLTLDILHQDWKDGGRLAQDLRSPGTARKSWNMLLTSTKPNENVTLSWPGLAGSVPRNYRLTLIDATSNQRYDLRSNSSISLTTGADKTRAVQIIAEPSRSGGAALITSFNVAPVRTRGQSLTSSVEINYALSSTADTRVYIRGVNGRALRMLTGSSTSKAVNDTGSTSGGAIWDLKDERGNVIPAGAYQIELVVHSSDGQVSRQVQPYIHVR